jgi:hypothetical protein
MHQASLDEKLDLDLLQPTETKDNITNEATENKNKVSTEQ